MSTDKPLSSMGQAALQYARHGWSVFPCRERDETVTLANGKERTFRAKAPYTGSGLKDATTDEAVIVGWWRRWPFALIGLPMGRNGAFALDFDPRVEEITDPDTGEVTGTREFTLDELKAALEAQIGVPLPRSITSLTQSGGVHVWFRHPKDGGDDIRNRGNLPRHVDVRGHGGYVIAPPSITLDEHGAEKGRYRWLRDRGDWRYAPDLADAPPELIAVLRDRGRKAAPATKDETLPGTEAQAGPVRHDPDAAVRKYALAALDGELQAIRVARSGERNAQLNRSAYQVASLVAAGAIDEAVARSSLHAAARANPGRDDDAQLLATIESGWAAGMQAPRDLAEVAAASRDRRERAPQHGVGFCAAAPARGGGGKSGSFRSGRVEGLSALEPGQAERLKRVAEGWLAARVEHVEPTRDALKKLAFSAGCRVGVGLIDEVDAEARIWAIAEQVADVQPGDIRQALADGIDRGFDIDRELLTQRCCAYPMTDFGIGERFRDRFGADFRFTTAKGWLGWDKRRWKVLDQEKDAPPAEIITAVFETVRAIQEEARFMARTGVRFELDETDGRKQPRLIEEDPDPLALDRWVPKSRGWEKLSAKLAKFGRESEKAGKPSSIAALARRWLTVPIEDFDRDPLAINVMNGTLRFSREDTPDGKRASVMLEAHARDDLNTRLAPVEFDRKAKCDVYDGFIKWAHPDDATRRYLHQVVGYTATGTTSEQKLWFHYGLGANGKSTAMDLWADVLGDYAGTIGIETFLDQGIKKRGEQASPDLARLGGVRLLRASEPERGARLNEALIKAATGGEPMAVRALHRGFFDLVPLFKLHIGGNYKPDIPGTDEGIWRRMKLVPWNAHVEDHERDEQLPDKLRAELSGVFNRIVGGLLDWLTHGLIEPDSVREATSDYREASDPLARFLKLCTVMDPDSRVQSSKLHEVFVAWCKAAGEKEWTNKGLSRAMQDKGFTKKASDGMQWIGMRLIREASDFVDENGRVLDTSGMKPPLEAAAERAPPPDDFDDVVL